MTRHQIGELYCTLLSDGQFTYPAAVLESDVSRQAIGTMPEHVPLPYTALLIEAPAQNVLIDTGAGALGPESGRLIESLVAIGVAPDQIDIVVLTHAHPDHIGGLLTSNGSLAFPNARVIVSRREWEFWLSLSVGGKLGTGDVMGVPLIEQLIHQWLTRYLFPFADKITLLDSDEEIVPGVEAFLSPGHTPGHLAVAVESSGQSFVYLADTVFLPQQVEFSRWTTAFDADPVALARTRIQNFSRAAHLRSLVAACHHRGVGYIEQAGGGFRWVDAQPALAPL